MAVVEPIAEQVGARRRLRLRSPATLAPIGEFDVEGASEVRAALERSRKVQPEWAALSLGERAHYLRRAVRVLLARQQEFLEVIVQETGKPETEALATELLASCDALEFYAKNARRVLADRRVPVHLMRSKRLRISYRPLGVVAIITPWNFPFLLSLNPTVQALVAGNAVLLKPSEVTPFSGRLVGELFRDARATAVGLVAGAGALGGFAIPWLHGAIGDRVGVAPAPASLALWSVVIAATARAVRRGDST